MTNITVNDLARSVGAPVKRLLIQMQEAGLPHTKSDDPVSENEKQHLLTFLKENLKESVASGKITTQRNTKNVIKNNQKAKKAASPTSSAYIKEENKSNHQRDDFNREELTLRLEKVAARNRPIVSLFAARCVLRVIPLIAQDQLFSHWMGIGQHDKRAHYLLSLWRGILSAWVYDEFTANKNASLANEAASALANTPWKLAADISTAVTYVNASVHMSIAAAGYAVHFARLAILNSPDVIDFDSANQEDLALIENGEHVKKLFLWTELDEHSKHLKPLSHWLNSIEKLADQDEKENEDRAQLVRKISAAHEKIYTGEYSDEEAENFLEQLNRYFNSYESIDSAQPKDEHEEKTKSSAVTEETLKLFHYTANLQQSSESISQTDHLNRQHLVNALAAILAHQNNSEHQTIGLLGDWGSGKSTWLGFLKKSLITNHYKNQPFLFGEFNAWAYEKTDNVQAGIAHEMIAALSSPNITPEDIETDKQQYSLDLRMLFWLDRQCQKLGWFFYRISLGISFAAAKSKFEIFKLLILGLLASAPWLLDVPILISDHLAEGSKTAGNLSALFWSMGFGFYLLKDLPKLLSNSMAKEFLTYVQLPNYAKHLGTIPEMRKNIETLCRLRLKTHSKNSNRLLFVVDDLDRCSPQGIVTVIEAVRLVLDIKNVTVVIAVDQHIALAALALHYKELAQHHKFASPRAIARDYLAKVIHLPIILTKPENNEVENYLENLWANTTPQEMLKTKKDIDITPIKEIENADEEPLAPTENKISNIREERHETSTIAAEPEPDAATNEKRAAGTESTKVAAEIEKVLGLTTDQKSAFIKWVNYFELTNPRQLKRLNNTYSLMLNADSNLDKASANETFKNTHLTDIKSYPILIALITMEYLNALDNQPLRKILKTQLQGLEIVEEFDSKGEKKITPTFNSIVTKEFISFFTQLSTETNKNLIKIVEPFVLPAIEC